MRGTDRQLNNPPALECLDLVKTFQRKTALNHAHLAVVPARIHALVGENGAGKSTLINIVSGLLVPDGGEVRIFGREERFGSPLHAVSAGIGMVHQHFLLADALTVAENVYLGRRASASGWKFDRRKAESEVAALSEQTGLAVNPRARVADLPVGMRQRVEIIKALSRGAKILLLDEPTAVLAPPEIDKLFDNLHNLRAAGRTIVIVSHKLDEVFAIATDVTVLRGGETVFQGSLSGLTPQSLAEKMIGRELPSVSTPPVDTGKARDVILELRNVRAGSALSIDHLEVRGGEIVGVCGVEGNGQHELAGVIAGTIDPDPAEPRAVIRLAGNELGETIHPRADAGVAYIPADRHREGLVLEMSLEENLHLRRPLTKRMGFIDVLDQPAMAANAARLLGEFGVAPPEPGLPAHALSGGNQQKVVLARELQQAPKLILACNPSRGLDVGAAEDVHRRLIAAAREKNAGVLLISTDLDEVLQLADRVIVLYRGRVHEAGARGVSKAEVGLAMVGAQSRD